MRDVLVGTATTKRVDFVSPLGTVAADVGSVSYTLYSHTGTVMRTAVVPTSVGATGVNIPLTAQDHEISTSRRFEKRTLLVSWSSDGESFTARLPYRVTPFLNFTTSEDEVRALLGLNSDELLDSEIDLFTAYLNVEADVTQATLTAALTAGTRVEASANILIAVQAAIAVLPSMRTRTPMTAADGSKRFERFRTVPDWDALAAELSGMRAALIADVTGSAGADQSLAVFAQPTDVITG